MGLFTRSKEVEQRDAAVEVLPPPRSSITSVSADEALGLNAVYRCVSILGTTVMQLPVVVRRGVAVVENVALVRKPDLNISGPEFYQQTTNSLALHGNAFWWVTRNSAGTPQNLQVLDPRWVSVAVDDTSNSVLPKVHYYYRGKKVQRKNIQHLRLFTLPGQPNGLGPIQAARHDLLAAVRLREFGDSVVINGGIPTGVLSSDQFLSQEQADAYRTAWDAAQNQRGLAVLGAGLSYAPISLSPSDMQWLENAQFSIAQIARLFGIPGIWLGIGIEGTSTTYSNVEDLGRNYIQTTAAQYLTVIEQALDELLPRGQNTRFQLDALMKANVQTRSQFYDTLVNLGAITPMEVRLSEGFPPSPPTFRIPDFEKVEDPNLNVDDPNLVGDEPTGFASVDGSTSN